MALQHEIQKKHSAEDKLSKVVAQETRPGVQGLSELGDVAVPEPMSHTWTFWRARPQTCQRRRRISPSKGCESPLWCRQRQHHAAEPGSASGSGFFLGKRSHFGNALTCTELGWERSPPMERCGFGDEARLLLGCPKVGSLLVPQCQAKSVIPGKGEQQCKGHQLGTQWSPNPAACPQGRGNSSARHANWEASGPQGRENNSIRATTRSILVLTTSFSPCRWFPSCP